MNRNSDYNNNTVILHETKRRVILASGLEDDSTNTKTGGLVQIYILHRTVKPTEAIQQGLDSVICGDCKHRGTSTFDVDGVVTETPRRCYVQVGKAPNAIWDAYRRGRYRKAKRSQYKRLFGGRVIRFGAYGDPVYIPLSIVEAIVNVCSDWTGYTHQWQDVKHASYAPYLMASADSVEEYTQATGREWRTFRVRAKDGAILPNEIVCPASKEAGYKTQCADCRLCNGKKHGVSDPRKNIVIIDHSVIANTKPLASAPLIQISGLAA